MAANGLIGINSSIPQIVINLNLLMDAKEEHAMLPVKQPQSPVLLGAAHKHLATFKAYVPPVPM